MNKPEAKPAPLMLARIPNTKHGRATLGGIREFLNTDGYRLAVEFSGPRRKNERGRLRYGTLKEDATAFRLYVTRKHAAAERDVLDALIDAEALVAFCKLRAKEAGIKLNTPMAETAGRECVRLRGVVTDLLKAARSCERLFKVALPKFNWRDSALDADAITLLNEVPGQLRLAIAKATTT
mgnify:FL=1